MAKEYVYSTLIRWTGNTGSGTAGYTLYERDYVCSAKDKADILGSSDPAFRGDHTRWNPEELLINALASCHMLWYLHLCADAKIIVESYEDLPTGKMLVNPDGSGAFTEVTLNPICKIADRSQTEQALQLHNLAHKKCFIANSINFPGSVKPNIL